MACPCHHCERRVVGCHSQCSDYKDWKAVEAVRKAKEEEERKLRDFEWESTQRRYRKK